MYTTGLNTPLTPHERSALIEFKRLVTRISHMGIIADWRLTRKGEAWNG